MMDNKYPYLHEFVPKKYGLELKRNSDNALVFNIFGPVTEEEIKEAEGTLTRPFPMQLKEFYLEIGDGYLTTPNDPPVDYDFYSTNEILSPMVSAHFYQGILEHQKQPKEEALHYGDNWLSLETLEILKPGDLPFFEICDSSRFLIMKLDSDNPNAIWALGNIKIEDSFERFIWRLYHESPWFYDDIIEAHYRNLT